MRSRSIHRGGLAAAVRELSAAIDEHSMMVMSSSPGTQQMEVLFYDGHCGLCHNAVKFVLKHDRSAAAFRFAPLQGKTFQATVPLHQRGGLPDSLIVLALDGTLLIRSNAWIHILRRLGGGWKTIATLVAIIPQPLRDLFYRCLARVRYSVFGRREDLCPILRADLRERFDP